MNVRDRANRYDILNRIVPHLLVEPFETAALYGEVVLEGWNDLMGCVTGNGAGLSLPQGVTSREDVVEAELRHRLWLQDCFGVLYALGQENDINLKTQPDRVDDFIERLRACKQSVAFLDLTLDSLIKAIILPEDDQAALSMMLQDNLEITSTTDRIADHLA